jgi:hypothetical protein
MRSIVERLHSGVSILTELQQKRIEAGDPQLGYDVERSIIEMELRDLERDIVSGAAVPSGQLVYVPRHRR